MGLKSGVRRPKVRNGGRAVSAVQRCTPTKFPSRRNQSNRLPYPMISSSNITPYHDNVMHCRLLSLLSSVNTLTALASHPPSVWGRLASPSSLCRLHDGALIVRLKSPGPHMGGICVGVPRTQLFHSGSAPARALSDDDSVAF